eukprot:4593708-Pleurochrysis_carterae.AAC.7
MSIAGGASQACSTSWEKPTGTTYWPPTLNKYCGCPCTDAAQVHRLQHCKSLLATRRSASVLAFFGGSTCRYHF